MSPKSSMFTQSTSPRGANRRLATSGASPESVCARRSPAIHYHLNTTVASPTISTVTGLAPRWPERKRKSQGLGSPETGVDSTKRTTTNQENIKYSKAVREVTYLNVRGISVMIRHAPYKHVSISALQLDHLPGFKPSPSPLSLSRAIDAGRVRQQLRQLVHARRTRGVRSESTQVQHSARPALAIPKHAPAVAPSPLARQLALCPLASPRLRAPPETRGLVAGNSTQVTAALAASPRLHSPPFFASPRPPHYEASPHHEGGPGTRHSARTPRLVPREHETSLTRPRPHRPRTLHIAAAAPLPRGRAARSPRGLDAAPALPPRLAPRMRDSRPRPAALAPTARASLRPLHPARGLAAPVRAHRPRTLYIVAFAPPPRGHSMRSRDSSRPNIARKDEDGPFPRASQRRHAPLGHAEDDPRSPRRARARLCNISHAALADTAANPRVAVHTRHAVSPPSPPCYAVSSAGIWWGKCRRWRVASRECGRGESSCSRGAACGRSSCYGGRGVAGMRRVEWNGLAASAAVSHGRRVASPGAESRRYEWRGARAEYGEARCKDECCKYE
ncbi:hypothetical protein DFH09DRAFT_1096422 [Mycena vulgaris]|nr:hypothetical protein DFH09DRAFT_1096422 [Mycena vulgaris]